MASQTLETIIAINAKVGNGFSEVGATLTELGSLVNGMSQKLIDFGKDSVNVYREYEKSMKDAEVAMSTLYGRNSRELSTIMSNLDSAATQWAASTIFHTDDVANAISEAAHAGWDYEQIMSGIPAAMELAQAGSLDLSEAVNYIVKSTNAAGIGFEDMGEFIDLWTFAANSSASTVGEFGDAMLRMGSTMRFAENTEELMTLIAITANAGSTGSEAGTLIRNAMLRLVAPTDKAEKAMAQLGATSEEAASLLGDEALAAANAELAAHGFSAYDQDGNMKSILDTYRELYMALGDIAGGYENIEKNGDAIGILSSIFPTRTITEALTLIRAAAEGYDGLYDSMKEGDAAGYGEYAAATMMNSLDGRIQTFESKVEHLKQVVGGQLADQVSTVVEGLGDMADSLAGMDEGSLNALIAASEVIAGAGPGLLMAGAAFRIIGMIMSPATGIGMTAIALTAAVAAVERLERADLESAFGTAEIDNTAIMNYVNGISSSIESAYSSVDAFRGALDESVASYEKASQTFSQQLLTDLVTNATLTDADKTSLFNLGDDMKNAVIEGVQNSTAASMSYWEMLFGGAGVAEEDEQFNNITGVMNSGYEQAIANIEQIGVSMREALTAAFADGTIDDAEYQNIMSYMRSYNDAIARAAAEAQSREDYITRSALFQKAQTASLDEIEKVADEITTARDAELDKAEQNYFRERAGLEYDYDQQIENGTATEEQKQAALTAAESAYEAHKGKISHSYDDSLYALWDSQIKQSDYSDAYGTLGELADQVLNNGLSVEQAYQSFKGMFDGNNANAGERTGVFNSKGTRGNLSDLLAQQISDLGGYDGLSASIDAYNAEGNTEAANNLMRLYAMQQISDNGATTGVSDFADLGLFGKAASVITGRKSNVYSMQGYTGLQDSEMRERLSGGSAEESYSAEVANETVKAIQDATGQSGIKSFFDTMGAEIRGENNSSELMEALTSMTAGEQQTLSTLIDTMGQTYDLGRVADDYGNGSTIASEGSAMREGYAAYQLMYGEAAESAEQYRIQVVPEVDESQLSDIGPVPLPIEPHVEGEDSVQALRDQNVTVDVDGDVQSLEATIQGEDGQTLMEYVSGDASELSAVISDQDGRTLTTYVNGNASGLASAIAAYEGKTITVNIQGNRMFASGGRATQASIFGEAGPEWAIPEEHSERTAQLLSAAAEASGFSWPELLARNGGLSANPRNTPSTLVYSPTVNVNDASGVERVLSEDKDRLERWYRERTMRDQMEVYA
ncbi:MAG: phage tail tape measure protein [Eubacteriales bacterium]|nr:phage tail tape measure protein [Eubacteriales bacterium]